MPLLPGRYSAGQDTRFVRTKAGFWSPLLHCGQVFLGHVHPTQPYMVTLDHLCSHLQKNLYLFPLFSILANGNIIHFVPQTRNLGIILNDSHFFTSHHQTIDYIYPLRAISFANSLSSMISSFHVLITTWAPPHLNYPLPPLQYIVRQDLPKIKIFHTFTSFSGFHSLDRR